MSFNDLERGSSSGPSRNSGGGRGGGGAGRTPLPLYRNDVGSSASSDAAVPPEFEALTKRIGIQIFKINSNVTAIQKLITLLSPGSSSAAAKSGQDWSKRIHDLIETTRDLVKDGTGDIKQLSTFPLSSTTSAGGSGMSAAKLTQSKLQRDFQQSALQFQKTQKDAVAKTRLKLEQEKQKERQLIKQQQQAAQSHSSGSFQPQRQSQLLLDEEEADGEEDRFGATSPDQAQLLQSIAGPSQADLEYQESLITSREAEIREIESGVQELNEIFRDLGNIVQEQGGMIDNIEFNINSIADNTAGADRELVVAHEYQRKAGRRCIVLLLVVGFVVAVVLLAVLS